MAKLWRRAMATSSELRADIKKWRSHKCDTRRRSSSPEGIRREKRSHRLDQIINSLRRTWLTMAQGTGNYREYLKSKHWKSVRRRHRRVMRYRCFLCGVRKNLELHHITYQNLGNELIHDLVYLCAPHHDQITFHDHDGSLARYLEKRRREALSQTRDKFGKLFKGVNHRVYRHKGSKLQYSKVKPGHHFKKLKNGKFGAFTWKAKELGII